MYDSRVQPGSIRALKDSIVEVVWITLVLVLELVEEVKEVKGECCCGTVNCCQKPADTEELRVL